MKEQNKKLNKEALVAKVAIAGSVILVTAGIVIGYTIGKPTEDTKGWIEATKGMSPEAKSDIIRCLKLGTKGCVCGWKTGGEKVFTLVEAIGEEAVKTLPNNQSDDEIVSIIYGVIKNKT